jgi:hypothetical protein
MIPLDYPRDGSERAEIVLFLVTDRGKWITSRRSKVDGGAVWAGPAALTLNRCMSYW